MKKRYWGFNWEVTPFTGQFGLFWKTKKGWRYFGFGPFSIILVIWFMFSKNDEFVMYQEDKVKRQ
jgi:hypothetical protein